MSIKPRIISMSELNNKGFSLIEVIMATTLMGVATVGIMTMMQSQFVAVSYMEDKLAKVEVERLVREVMEDSRTCNLMFNGRTITADKTTSYDLTEFEGTTGSVMYTSNTDSEKLTIGQMSFRNRSIDVIDSSGMITLVVPVGRVADTGLKDFRSIEVNFFASVNSAFEITSCSTSSVPSFDPSGLERDGWRCTCNGDYSSSTEGGATFCILQQEGRITDMWVAPDPWTKATEANFTCANGTPPNPPGTLPLLRWRYNNYSFVSERCNMTAGATTTASSPPCP